MGRPLLSALALALVCAGCATEAPGQPVPAPSDSSTPPSTSQSPSGEAPPIRSPELDLARYESRVCDLLTPSQLAPFAIRDPGEQNDDPVGPSCTWKAPPTVADPWISVAIHTKTGYGLDGVYARKAKWPFFEDAGEINGYPAVHVDAAGDGTEGRCATTVGVRQDLIFDVLVQINRRSSPDYRTPCALSDKAASAVIDTARGGR